MGGGTVDAGVDPELVARADRPGLAPLWAELSRRLGASDRPVRRARLSGLTAPEREALADLLGLASLPAPDVNVSVERVCRSLRVDEPTLRRLVERLHGPLDNRSARRAAETAARRQLWEEVEAAVAGRGLDGWVARLRAAGVPDGDVEAHRTRLAPVLGVVAALPLAPPRPLAMVAQRHLGDPHALDQGTWAGALVADAAAGLAGLPTPTSAALARAALARVGVVTDQLSSPVLTSGLRGPGGWPRHRLVVGDGRGRGAGDADGVAAAPLAAGGGGGRRARGGEPVGGGGRRRWGRRHLAAGVHRLVADARRGVAAGPAP
jgi:hypothetical protein